MKRQIRLGVFETNSSSTHSLTMCSKEEYEKWESGELMLNENWNIKKQFITREDAIEYLKSQGYYDEEDDLDEVLRDYEFYTSDYYLESDYLEVFSSTYKTSGGEEVVAFGKYGYNG